MSARLNMLAPAVFLRRAPVDRALGFIDSNSDDGLMRISRAPVPQWIDVSVSEAVAYLALEYFASLCRKSPESTGRRSTFVELAPRTLRNCEKYAGRPHALKTSGPSINE
jgi:hypothetical protein